MCHIKSWVKVYNKIQTETLSYTHISCARGFLKMTSLSSHELGLFRNKLMIYVYDRHMMFI